MTTLTKAGRYEISGELGRGAMGVVYRATDPVIGRTVAVKTLQLSEAGTGLTRAELLARFQTEARAAGLLAHPNIVVIFDAGEEDGLFFITMELVEGKSLQSLLDAGQMFPLSRVLHIMEQTCSALQFAHDRNIVHRDIKPANLMLTPDDTVKVTDFGTAKILQFGTVQQTAHVMGTPSYMSPEQVKGKIVDGRSDIFSLGVLLYEMVTGEKPFPGQNITTVIYKIVNEQPVAPRDIDPSVHPGLNAVIMKSLAKEPEARYQSCREFLEELRNYRSIPSVANPNSTLPLGSPLQRAALSGFTSDPQVATTSRSLASRTGNPTQTPIVRRTAVIAAVPERKKSNTLGTVLAAIFLLAVIAFGAQKIRPVFQAARQLNVGNPSETERVPTATAKQSETVESSGASVTPIPVDNSPQPALTQSPKENSLPGAPASGAATSNSLSAVAADYKRQLQQVASEQHLGHRLSIKGSGMTLNLAGKLRPAEHGALLKFLRGAPVGVQVVDDIQYDDTAEAPLAAEDPSSHPTPVKGRSGIHIITNVIGATAYLGTDDGSSARQCETPCGFSGLLPGNYNLQVLKSGFQPIRTVLQLDAGKSVDQKLQLEPLAQGLFISSEPAGADVFINGDKQSGQTPVSLPLAPGKYNLVLRLPGYEAFSGQVIVGDFSQTKIAADLHHKGNRVAWAQVDSNPAGAEVWLDGQPTGNRTPARIEISSGIHNITLKLDGYTVSRRAVQASAGGTVNVSENLLKSKVN
jgi:eukaryotic-like serine/threonine-protein kinase